MPKNLIKDFIGKEVTISLYNESFDFTGTIIEIEDNWLKFETKKNVQLINIEMIRNIILKKTNKK